MSALRILIAEDNDDHRFLLSRALRRVATLPLEIIEARDGQEALDYLLQRGSSSQAAEPHLVFLDLSMPGTDGFTVLRAMSATPELAGIPVVVLTSSNRPEDIDVAYELGGNSFVTKARNADFSDHLQCIARYWTVHTELPGVPA